MRVIPGRRPGLSTALALAALVVPPAAVRAELVVERVIGREFPGTYKHPAAIAPLDNGDLYLAYYGGGGEYEDDSKVWGMRRPAGAQAWTQPEVIADTPFLAEGNPVVWQAPDGVLWLWYVQRYGDTWSDSRIHAKISRDRGQTWSDSLVVAFEKGMMVRAKPIVTPEGGYLLPIYHETGADREHVGAETASLALHYDPAGHTFTESGRITSRLGNLQPSFARLDDGRIVAYCRRGGGYEPRDDAWLVRSESADGGRTWSPGVETRFPNPNAATDFMRLQSGNLILAFNDSKTDRSDLTVAVSTDGDMNYPHRLVMPSRSADLAYPFLAQRPDGTILLLFTDARSTIYLASFREEDLVR